MIKANISHGSKEMYGKPSSHQHGPQKLQCWPRGPVQVTSLFSIQGGHMQSAGMLGTTEAARTFSG